MSATANKQIMQEIFAGLAVGEYQAFRDALAEDFRWIMMGTTEWSGTYTGRQRVLDDLFAPLFANFASRYTNTAGRMIAEGDSVVVTCSGRVTTKSGKPYNNHYCWVCRIDGGKLVEIVEYMDTQLVATALDAPPRR